jgi:hypothetical protein
MFQVFHMDVAKVNRDVAYVVVVARVCFKILFPMFHLFFQMYVAYVSHICYKCFIWILRTCVMVFKCFQVFFLQVFQTYVASV